VHRSLRQVANVSQFVIYPGRKLIRDAALFLAIGVAFGILFVQGWV
jgi:hypothetical protein